MQETSERRDWPRGSRHSTATRSLDGAIAALALRCCQSNAACSLDGSIVALALALALGRNLLAEQRQVAHEATTHQHGRQHRARRDSCACEARDHKGDAAARHGRKAGGLLELLAEHELLWRLHRVLALRILHLAAPAAVRALGHHQDTSSLARCDLVLLVVQGGPLNALGASPISTLDPARRGATPLGRRRGGRSRGCHRLRSGLRLCCGLLRRRRLLRLRRLLRRRLLRRRLLRRLRRLLGAGGRLAAT
mmetsp:Transcript_79385/g.214703  ORF Transcript_79385/g.214703 Transcript_79385/m.214703 type:complete len:251 (+) Transcript_79385:73-825(+)